MAFSYVMALGAVLLLHGAAHHRHCPSMALAVMGALVLQSEVVFTVQGRPATPNPPRTTLPPSPLPPALRDNCNPVSKVIEGPFWVDEDIQATNLRLNLSYGVPLNLTIKVSNGTLSASQGSCVPIEKARVDLWQCRYDGLYSDVGEGHFQESTIGETWLRGYQYSNSTGHTSFLTIIPGWYIQRTPHIHIRVRIYEADGNTISYDDTTQLYFDDTITTAIYTSIYPYNERSAAGLRRDTFNNNDSLFRSANLLTLMGSYKRTHGYRSFLEVKLPFDDDDGIMATS